MEFPYKTKTRDGRKAAVLGVLPDGRLLGFIKNDEEAYFTTIWNHDGTSYDYGLGIAMPLRIKPLTAYRMRGGGVAWTSGLVGCGWIHGLVDDKTNRAWRVSDGRWNAEHEHELDLVEELPPNNE